MLKYLSNIKFVCEPRVAALIDFDLVAPEDFKRMDEGLTIEDINKLDIFTKSRILVRVLLDGSVSTKNLRSLLCTSILEDYKKAGFTGSGYNLQFLGHETNLLLSNHIKYFMEVPEFKEINTNVCGSIAQILVEEMKDVLRCERDTMYLVTFDDGYEELASVEMVQEELESMQIEPESCFRSIKMNNVKIRRALDRIKENLSNKDIIDYIVLSTIINISNCYTLSDIANEIVKIMKNDLGIIFDKDTAFDIYIELCEGF